MTKKPLREGKNQEHSAAGESRREQPQVFALCRHGSAWQLTRRGFLTTAAAGASAASTGGAGAQSEGPSGASEEPAANEALPVAGAPQTAAFAHRGAVTALAVTADGAGLASASPDGTVKLWSLADGRLLETMSGRTGDLLRYGGGAQALVALPDRQLLVSASGEFADRVMLSNVPEGAVLKSLAGFGGEVTAIGVAPGGAFFATGTVRGIIYVWSSADYRLAQTLKGHTAPITALALAPDAKHVVSQSLDNTAFLWADGELQGPLIEQQRKLAALAVVPGGKEVILASGDEEDPAITLWSLADGESVRDLKEHKKRITALAASPDGSRLASGDADGRLLVWDVTSGKRLRALGDPSVWKGFVYAHRGAVHALAATPDGALLASGSGEEKIKLWSLPDGKHQKTLDADGKVYALAISPDGKRLVAGVEKQVKVWGLPEGEPGEEWPAQEGTVSSLAFTPDGRRIALGLLDGTVRLWSFPQPVLEQTLRAPNRPVYALAITPDGSLLASACGELIYLWSLPEGKHSRTLKGHRHWVYGLAVSADGRLLVSASNDRAVRFWSLPGGEPVGQPENMHSAVAALALTPDGALLAAGTDDRTVRLGRLGASAAWKTLGEHGAAVGALAVTPDGKTLVSASADGVIALWDLPAGSFRSYLFDKEASTTDAVQYTARDAVTGQVITFTLPCGSPIPAGAVCVCNCVPGSYSAPSSGGGGGGGHWGHYWFPT